MLFGIGLIVGARRDKEGHIYKVDGHNFPNLPLMKLSAYHKFYRISKTRRLIN